MTGKPATCKQGSKSLKKALDQDPSVLITNNMQASLATVYVAHSCFQSECSSWSHDLFSAKTPSQ